MMEKYTSAYFYVIIDDKEKIIFYEFDKSELTELFERGMTIDQRSIVWEQGRGKNHLNIHYSRKKR